MLKLSLNTTESLKDFIESVDDGTMKVIKQIDNFIYAEAYDEKYEIEVSPGLKTPCSINDVINGKNHLPNIVNMSLKDEEVYIYTEDNGQVNLQKEKFNHWVLSTTPSSGFSRLKGKSHYNFIKRYSHEKYNSIKPKLYQGDYYHVVHPIESYMMQSGHTYFKGMQLSDVSILSFDIETTGVNPHASDAKVLCIGNTYRSQGKYIKRIFRTDEYKNNGDMLKDWCAFVNELNPSIITGYNIVMFDLPYLLAEAERYNSPLNIGRDKSFMGFESRKKPREFRKDGSQSYDYRRIEIFGREIIDMWMVTIKFDVVAKKYDSYALKHIIKIEGLEKPDRKHYDASKIKIDWQDPDKRKDICDYCMDDSEDPIKLADMMLTPTFLFTAYIPKPFQIMVESNTGGQINSLMVRSYLQEDWAIPKGDETSDFQGAISNGFPGVYKNVLKLDVSSLYPSIMRQYEIRPHKDYMGNFLKMLEYFTLQRLQNKKLAKETGKKYYDDVQNMQKIGINSAYGFLTTPGLNFNDMKAGSSVTRYGREVLEKSILWACGKKYEDLVVKEEDNEDA